MMGNRTAESERGQGAEGTRRLVEALDRALDQEDLALAQGIAARLAQAAPSLSEQEKRSLEPLKRVLDRLCFTVAERRQAIGTELARIKHNRKAVGRYHDSVALRRRTRLDNRA